MKQKNLLHCNCVVLLQPLPSASLLLFLLLTTGRQCKGLLLFRGHGRLGKFKDRQLQSFCCKPPVWSWLEDFKEGWMALENVLAGKCLVVSCVFAMCSPHCLFTNLSLFYFRTCQYFSLSLLSLFTAHWTLEDLPFLAKDVLDKCFGFKFSIMFSFSRNLFSCNSVFSLVQI